MRDSLHIAVVGPGAIGLFYAARLTQVGARVSLLLRSDYERVRQQGIEVRSAKGLLKVPPSALRACSSPEEVGPVDLVLVTLKATANEQLARLVPPLLGPSTAVLTLQNGLGTDELLAGLVGSERVLSGLAFIACSRLAPGVLECLYPGTITLGEFGRPASERARLLADWFTRAGVPTQVTDKVAEARWKKLIWNVPFNGLSIAAGGLTTDLILADPGLAKEVRCLMDEVASAAAAQGFHIPEEFIRGQIEVTPKLGAYRPSSMIDWKAGREVEVETIWGEALRRALAAGASVPRMSLLYALLKSLCAPQARR